MANQSTEVKALQKAILERAEELAGEYINQGKMLSSHIIQDARDKVQLMEKKELLLAKDNAEREYQRLCQASELRLQSEMDRNRWGLVQSAMDSIIQRVSDFAEKSPDYESVLFTLLENGVKELAIPVVVAELNNRDYKQLKSKVSEWIKQLDVEVRLSSENCSCSGGIRLLSEDGSMMVNNTFEGLLSRKQNELMRVIFERMFSQVQSIGGGTHG